MNIACISGRIANIKEFEKCVIVAVALPLYNRKEQREDVTFIDCIAFGSTKDFITKYFEKGKYIEIKGYLKKTEHEGIYSTAVMIEDASFCGAKKD